MNDIDITFHHLILSYLLAEKSTSRLPTTLFLNLVEPFVFMRKDFRPFNANFEANRLNLTHETFQLFRVLHQKSKTLSS